VSGRLVASHFRLFPAVQRLRVWDNVVGIIRATISRRELLDREPRLLEDVGLTPTEALIEARRVPWDTSPPPRRPRRSGMRGRAKLVDVLDEAYRRHRSRRQIARLDGRLLKDMGVSFAEAEAEANKPFWRG
jgi:uncharacterized protein YjiS (DUF1127 family)